MLLPLAGLTPRQRWQWSIHRVRRQLRLRLLARRRWQWATKQVRRLLRLRLLWHYLGVYLQDKNLKAITDRVERVKGVLRHKKR